MQKMKENKTLIVLIKTLLCMVFIVMALLLPVLTESIAPGYDLLLMNFSVLLCGFICGGSAGGAAGLLSPFIGYYFFQKPELLSQAIPYAAELVTLGCLCGYMYKSFPKKAVFVYLNLIISILLGRTIFLAAHYCVSMFTGAEFSLAAFFRDSISAAFPGFLIQILLIPLLVLLLKELKMTINT